MQILQIQHHSTQDGTSTLCQGLGRVQRRLLLPLAEGTIHEMCIGPKFWVSGGLQKKLSHTAAELGGFVQGRNLNVRC